MNFVSDLVDFDSILGCVIPEIHWENHAQNRCFLNLGIIAQGTDILLHDPQYNIWNIYSIFSEYDL